MAHAGVSLPGRQPGDWVEKRHMFNSVAWEELFLNDLREPLSSPCALAIPENSHLLFPLN